jgi:fumarylpyruvate hydrolase
VTISPIAAATITAVAVEPRPWAFPWRPTRRTPSGGYRVGVDLTRRDLQTGSRKKEQPWEVGKSFDGSAPCGVLVPASKIGHPSKGKIRLSVNGTVRQNGDLTEMIWNVPEIIGKLSLQVSLAAGDIIMTGTPAGVAALSAGDKVECGVDGVGTLKFEIGKPA